MAPRALGGVALSWDSGSLIPESPSLVCWSGSALHWDDEVGQEVEVEVEVKSHPRCVPQCPHEAILHAYPGNQESFSVGCFVSKHWYFIILLCCLHSLNIIMTKILKNHGTLLSIVH